LRCLGKVLSSKEGDDSIDEGVKLVDSRLNEVKLNELELYAHLTIEFTVSSGFKSSDPNSLSHSASSSISSPCSLVKFSMRFTSKGGSSFS